MKLTAITHAGGLYIYWNPETKRLWWFRARERGMYGGIYPTITEARRAAAHFVTD